MKKVFRVGDAFFKVVGGQELAPVTYWGASEWGDSFSYGVAGALPSDRYATGISDLIFRISHRMKNKGMAKAIPLFLVRVGRFELPAS